MGFKGFEPDSELRSLAKDILSQIEASSPDSSAQEIQMTRNKGGYHAEIRISSVAGVFFTQTDSKTAEQALNDIHAKMDHKLVAWKKTSFAFA